MAASEICFLPVRRGKVREGMKINLPLLSTRKVRAFTLLEVLIMSAVGLGLVAIVYSFFVSSTRDNARSGKKLQSVQTAAIFFDRLQNDISQAFYLRGRYEPKIITVNSKPQGLSFYRIVSKSFPPDKHNPIEIEKVTYQFAESTSQMCVNGKPLSIGRFKFVAFELNKSNFYKSPPVFGDTVTVSIIAAADEDAEISTEKGNKRDMTVQVGTFCFRQQAAANYYHNWVFYKPLVQVRGGG
jgi:type II secretory pathway pseudopilin PulG